MKGCIFITVEVMNKERRKNSILFWVSDTKQVLRSWREYSDLEDANTESKD